MQCFFFWHVFIHYNMALTRHARRSRWKCELQSEFMLLEISIKNLNLLSSYCVTSKLQYSSVQNLRVLTVFTRICYFHVRWLFHAYSSWNFGLLYSRCIDIVTKLQGGGNSSSIWRWIDFPAERITELQDFASRYNSSVICGVSGIHQQFAFVISETEEFVVANTI
jgi:hypothetical protein